MSIIIAIICVFGVCAGIGFALLIAKKNFDAKEAAEQVSLYGRSDGENTEVKQSKKGIIGVIVAAVCVIVLLLVPFSLHTVNTGEVAVVKVFGEARDIRPAGIHFDFWLTKSYERYDTKIQKIDISTASYSSDAQTMDIEMTVQYQIDADKVLEITQNYGSLELLQQKIESVVVEQTKAVLSGYKAMDIIANRASMSPLVETAIRKAIGDKYFVSINTVVLTDIEFTDVFEKAVEDKMVANAQAKLLTAKAEKEANELLQKSLTPEILKEEWIQKWNGKLPATLAGDDTTIAVVP